MSTEVYRQTKLGDSLVDALEELLDNEKITPELAIKVLSEFDTSYVEAIKHSFKAKSTFKGKLDTYRNCEGVHAQVQAQSQAADLVVCSINPLNASSLNPCLLSINKIDLPICCGQVQATDGNQVQATDGECFTRRPRFGKSSCGIGHQLLLGSLKRRREHRSML